MGHEYFPCSLGSSFRLIFKFLFYFFCMRKNSQDQLEAGEANDLEFSGSPVACNCPYCREPVVTFIKAKASWLSWVGAIFSILLTGPLSCLLGPILWHWAKETVHSCPKCLNRIATVPVVALPTNWMSEILTFRLGGCACVLTWKYLLAGLSVFSFFLLLRLGSRGQFIGVETEKTVSDFLSICGREPRVENPIRCEVQFDKDFFHRSVHWSGRVHAIEGGPYPWLLLEVAPSEFLATSLPGNLYSSAAELKPEDSVAFHATFINPGPPASLNLHKIEKT